MKKKIKPTPEQKLKHLKEYCKANMTFIIDAGPMKGTCDNEKARKIIIETYQGILDIVEE